MLGLEPVAAVGLASNVFQFVEFTAQLCLRIKELCTSSSGLPKELEKQAVQLSSLLGVLKGLAQRREGPTLADEVLENCLLEAQGLDLLLKGLKIEPDRGRLKSAKLALQSLRQDKNIEKLQLHLSRLVDVLDLHLQIRTESSVSEVLKEQKNHRGLLQEIRDLNIAMGKSSEQIEPIWMVPINRNPYFVGRKEVLEQLENKLLGQSDQYQGIAVLHGLAGIGKSQVALEYIFRHRSPDAAVFWVHASSIARFVDSYKRIASEYQIPGRDDPNIDTLQLVQNWLETKCPFRWSMVVDNLDDRAGFLERSEDSETKKAICEYVPQTAQGVILYTTRSRDIGIDLSPGRDPIMVHCLKFDEAQALLGQSLVSDSPEDDQLALFESLDYLPLAIAQASSFMKKRRKNIAEYLDLIQDDSTRSQILSQKNYIHDRAGRSSESVVSTWWVTFSSIKRENERAAELLAMMSLLDRHEIPVSLMREPDEGIFGFEEAIGLLEDFSLITTFSNVKNCHQRALELLQQMVYDTKGSLVFGEMHRLVQESTKAWLSQPDGNAADTATKTLQRIGRCFEVIPERMLLCNLLYPHLNASLCTNSEMFETSKKRFDDRPDDFDCRISMLQELCQYLILQKRFRQSEQHIRLAMSMCQTYRSDHYPYTHVSMELHALVYCTTGRVEEGCAILAQSLRVREQTLGLDHPETLKAVHKLGHLLSIVGNLGESEDLYCRSLSGNQQKLLEDRENEKSWHETSTTMTGLASVLVSQGEHQRALDLLNEAIKSEENLHEVYQDRRWSIMSELAQCFCQCGRYQEAHSFLEPVLERERVFYGDTHPCTLHLRRQLAIILWSEGRFDEAEELMKGIFEDWADCNSPDSSDRIKTLCNIGDMQFSRGKFREAEITFERCLHMLVGRGQGWYSTSTNEVRDLQHDILVFQGKLEEAKAYMLPSGEKPALDAEESSEADRLRQRSKFMFVGSNFGDSVSTQLSKAVVPIKCSGPDESDTEQPRTDIASSLLSQRRYEEAYQLGRDNLAWTKRKHGWDDHQTQEWILLLALASEGLGNFDESEDLWRQLLYWHNYQFRQAHFMIVEANNAIARLAIRRRDLEAAEQACQRSLAIHPAHLKKIDPRLVFNTMVMLGSDLMLQGRLEEADTELSLAYNHCAKVFGNYDADAIHCLKLLIEISKYIDNVDDREELYYVLGVTLALPSNGREEDFDESASESDGESVTMALHTHAKGEYCDDGASKSDHDSDSSSWETTYSDSSHNGE